jgi:Skp family chaperone for outer membrane proteins
MTKIATLAALSAAVLAVSPASAQQLPGAVIAVANVDRASNECNACKTALATLKGQLNGLQTLQNQLGAPLEAEQKSLQAAISALGDKQPDAALTARVNAFEKKQADANRTYAAREQAFNANRAYVMQQIGAKLDPALTTVMAKRGATMIVDSRVALKVSPALDVTNDLIAQLNATLTSIATTAPAAAAAPKAAPAKPAGR